MSDGKFFDVFPYGRKNNQELISRLSLQKKDSRSCLLNELCPPENKKIANTARFSAASRFSVFSDWGVSALCEGHIFRISGSSRDGLQNVPCCTGLRICSTGTAQFDLLPCFFPPFDVRYPSSFAVSRSSRNFWISCTDPTENFSVSLNAKSHTGRIFPSEDRYKSSK